jgi:hypothetical protein
MLLPPPPDTELAPDLKVPFPLVLAGPLVLLAATLRRPFLARAGVAEKTWCAALESTVVAGLVIGLPVFCLLGILLGSMVPNVCAAVPLLLWICWPGLDRSFLQTRAGLAGDQVKTRWLVLGNVVAGVGILAPFLGVLFIRAQEDDNVLRWFLDHEERWLRLWTRVTLAVDFVAVAVYLGMLFRPKTPKPSE